MFSLTAIAWLTVSYWDTIRPRLLPQQNIGLPGRRMALAGVILVVLLASLGARPNHVASALSGFMPSSGGTGDYDPFARNGVNDGDSLIAGTEDIKSFGPIEDAPFVDSEDPSLYDVFNDLYDEPVRQNRTQDRAIALPPELLAPVRQRMAKTKKSAASSPRCENVVRQISGRFTTLTARHCCTSPAALRCICGSSCMICLTVSTGILRRLTGKAQTHQQPPSGPKPNRRHLTADFSQIAALTG